MKTVKYYLILLIILFSINNLHAGEKSSIAGLKILSFNIRYGTANDGENSWEFRKDLLFEVLKEEKADIIGIQEALDEQLKEILAHFPEYESIGVGRDDGISKGEYAAILYRKEKLSSSEKGWFWFSDTPEVPGSKTWGNNITRICTWARMTEKETGREFYFYNLHLDHESQNSREKSSLLLLKHLKERHLPAVITGDFNAGEVNAAVKILFEGGFEDSFRKVHPDVKDASTFHAFKGGISGDKIDYILCTKEFKVFSAEIIRKNRNNKYPSDHYPVSALLSL